MQLFISTTPPVFECGHTRPRERGKLLDDFASVLLMQPILQKPRHKKVFRRKTSDERDTIISKTQQSLFTLQMLSVKGDREGPKDYMVMFLTSSQRLLDKQIFVAHLQILYQQGTLLFGPPSDLFCL